MIMRKKVEAGELTDQEAQAMMNGTTLRPPRMKQWMWPTPKASGQEKLDTLIKRETLRSERAVQHNLTEEKPWRCGQHQRQERSQRTKQFKTYRGGRGQLERIAVAERNGWWDFEPNVGRVAHGISGRVHRLKGLGNSIVPQIVEEIGKALIKGMKE